MKKIILTIVFFFVSVFSAEFENPKSVIRPGTELCFDSDYLTFQFGKACSNDFINWINLYAISCCKIHYNKTNEFLIENIKF